MLFFKCFLARSKEVGTPIVGRANRSESWSVLESFTLAAKEHIDLSENEEEQDSKLSVEAWSGL